MLNLQKAVIIASKINKSTPNDSVMAIPYREEDSNLIGTFIFEDHNYAIAYLEKSNPETILTEQEQIEIEKKDFLSTSFHLMSDYVKFKIQKDFGDKTSIYKTQDGGVFSKIDLKFLDNETIKSLHEMIDSTTGQPIKTEHFFKTDKAIKFILETYMDKKELKEFQEKIDKEVGRIERMVLTSLPTKENPVVLDLVGIDDISFTKTFKTVEQAIDLLNNIATNGHDIVFKEMVES